MKGEGDYQLVWPEAHRASLTKGNSEIMAEELAPFDPALYARLKDVRARLAREHRVPPYGVFSNKTLEAFARLRPASVESAMRIKGVGAVKAARFLEPFLEMIRQDDTEIPGR
jgi:ATP-dependent DNA helicase RecQ